LTGTVIALRRAGWEISRWKGSAEARIGRESRNPVRILKWSRKEKSGRRKSKKVKGEERERDRRADQRKRVQATRRPWSTGHRPVLFEDALNIDGSQEGSSVSPFAVV
jgi:hypothetical protein